jgi:hypothetical protein
MSYYLSLFTAEIMAPRTVLASAPINGYEGARDVRVAAFLQTTANGFVVVASTFRRSLGIPWQPRVPLSSFTNQGRRAFVLRTADWARKLLHMPLVLGLPAGPTAQSQGDLAGSPLGCAV